MKFSELPQEWQDKLNEDRKTLFKKNQNGKWDLILYNKEGTRFFWAHYSSPVGRYSYAHWWVEYGPIGFRSEIDKKGNTVYVLCKSKKHFDKSLNGTTIPGTVRTKKDAIEVARAIGIFDI